MNGDPRRSGADEADPSAPALRRPTSTAVAGFWRRLGAFVVDGLLLALIGQAMAMPFADFWFQAGPYGRFVGTLMALAYFGLMESHLGGGQTLGMRLLGVAVRSAGNEPISVARSLLRTLVWLAPFSLNGWALPELRNPLLAWLDAAIVFGVGLAVVATMVFNRRSRQGLHDLLCATYVIRVDGEAIDAFPTAAPLQWIVAGALVAVGLVLPSLTPLTIPATEQLAGDIGGRWKQMLAFQRATEADPRFFTVGVFDRRSFQTGGATSRMLRIESWYRGAPSAEERQRATMDLAKAAFAHFDRIDEFDQMQIAVTWAYDLGIASGQSSHVDSQPIATWNERVR